MIEPMTWFLLFFATSCCYNLHTSGGIGLFPLWSRFMGDLSSDVKLLWWIFLNGKEDDNGLHIPDCCRWVFYTDSYLKLLVTIYYLRWLRWPAAVSDNRAVDCTQNSVPWTILKNCISHFHHSPNNHPLHCHLILAPLFRHWLNLI